MKYRSINKENKIFLTEIGLGGAPIGNLYHEVSNNVVYETLNEAWNQGIRYFDTAPQYGSGLSEQRIGYFLNEKNREDFIFSTKVGKLLNPSLHYSPADEEWFKNPLPRKVVYDYSYSGFKKSVYDSLQRTGLGYFDIVHIHDLDNIVLGDKFSSYFKEAMESGYPALVELKKEGFIKAISLGVKEWKVCLQALNYGDFDCFMLQDNYTLLDHDALEFFNHCSAKGIKILLAGPFSSGVLVKGSISQKSHYKYKFPSKSIIRHIKKLEAICSRYNVSLPSASLQFPLRNRCIASVVTGMRRSEHVLSNVSWLNSDIPEEFWSSLKYEGLIP